MLTLIFAVTLAATTQPGPSARLSCCERPQSLTAQISTESKNRVGHVVSPAILTTAFYGGAMYFGASSKQARVISVALSVAAIVGKEFYDQSTEARAFSTLDVALGLGGTAIGLLAAEAIEWPEEKSERPAPRLGD